MLVYEEPFWEEHRDIFGLLNDAEIPQSLNQQHYARHRGRFYLFWNCIKTSGRPMLIALMAGNAAYETEQADTSSLVQEVTARLAKVFAPKIVPKPTEVIVTRWRSDRFARGSYSYMGPHAEARHYDAMARPIGPLHFAGEATCGTHPATVHGAYLSGLRAACEVMESILGPIPIEEPLVPARSRIDTLNSANGSAQKRKLEDAVPPLMPQNNSARNSRGETLDSMTANAIFAEIGERPLKPIRPGVNPFILWQKENWQGTKARCDEQRRRVTGDPEAKATKTDVRNALSQAWRSMNEEAKKPYVDATQQARDTADAWMAEYKERAAQWEREAARIRQECVEKYRQASVDADGSGSRKSRRSTGEGEA